VTNGIRIGRDNGCRPGLFLGERGNMLKSGLNSGDQPVSSIAAKKNVRSLMIGPPMLPPKSFWRNSDCGLMGVVAFGVDRRGPRIERIFGKIRTLSRELVVPDL